MNIFPTRVKELRIENNLTQQQIADKIGIKQSTYSGYENGTYYPQLDILDKIANVFKVSIDYLVGFAFDAVSTEEEKTHFNKIIQKTGLTKIDMLVEGIKHAPEVVKAKKEKREVQPRTENMKKFREASREIKNSNP